MRDMASVVTVKEIWPLEGKDKVQGASFKENGYEVMLGKDINPGDLMIFIQADAILPEIPHWEFLRKRCYREDLKGFLIKPMKFASIKSWGLACSLEDMQKLLDIKKLKAGQDVTEALHIRKYETIEDASPVRIKVPPFIQFCKDKKCLYPIYKLYTKLFVRQVTIGFPDWLISKSDETVIQNCPRILEEWKDYPVYISEKIEGQSFTVLLDPKSKKHDLIVCSRNNRIVEKGSNFQRAAFKYDIKAKLEKVLKETGKYLIVQGEQCGPDIQKNIYQFKSLEWFVYTVKEYDPNTKECRQLDFCEMLDVCKKLELQTVPIISSSFPLKVHAATIEDIVKFAEKVYWRISKDGTFVPLYIPLPQEKLWKHYAQAEGIVVRSMKYDKSKNEGFSFKVKNYEYAEKGLGAIASIKFE